MASQYSGAKPQSRLASRLPRVSFSCNPAFIRAAARDIEKKWTMAYQDWGVIYSQLSIYFEDILKNYV